MAFPFEWYGDDRPVFGKRVGHSTGEFQPGEVVTICDHLLFLGLGQLKPEIAGEPLKISFDRLIERLRVGPVKLGQVGVKQHPLPTDQKDTRFDPVHQYNLSPLLLTHFALTKKGTIERGVKNSARLPVETVAIRSCQLTRNS
jgi:hypothetical protein